MRFSKIYVIFHPFFYLLKQFRISILVPLFQTYFPRYLIQNLAKLADGKLSSLHISFVQLVNDLMIVGFPFGCMFLSYNFRSIEAFSRLKCFELTLF